MTIYNEGTQSIRQQNKYCKFSDACLFDENGDTKDFLSHFKSKSEYDIQRHEIYRGVFCYPKFEYLEEKKMKFLYINNGYTLRKILADIQT